MSSEEHQDGVTRRQFATDTLKAGAALALAGRLPRPAAAKEMPEAGRRLTDDELLDFAQKQTLTYFTEFAHRKSGMARECSNDNSPYGRDTVAVGGTGFGIMGIIAGISRGFIPRQEALNQLVRIVDFLQTADHHNGIFPHWLNGQTGKTFVFPKSHDDGADLVETSFLMMGLLTARQYFQKENPQDNTPQEKHFVEQVNKLWKRADWKFHQREKSNELLWHWSPHTKWELNLPIKGWNEALMTHILAASSPTHAVAKEVYHEGWAGGNDFINSREHHGIHMPLGPEGGGPLFMAHYSFMGLDPQGLKDKYADYWKQNVSHTLINRAHCIANPNKHEGYSEKCWGLTASFNHLEGGKGYSDHSPSKGKDVGVIAPTAALSSFPYTPKYSMQVLRHLYEDHDHKKILGRYGFVDAFKADKSWYSNTYLAIDQGPIISMIENHRSGLLWKLFMSCPEVQNGLDTLGFKSPHFKKGISRTGLAQPTPSTTIQQHGPLKPEPITTAPAIHPPEPITVPISQPAPPGPMSSYRLHHYHLPYSHVNQLAASQMSDPGLVFRG